MHSTEHSTDPGAHPSDGAPSEKADHDQEAETGALSGELLRVILIASFGALLLNLSSTTINVAIDKLMAHFEACLLYTSMSLARSASASYFARIAFASSTAPRRRPVCTGRLKLSPTIQRLSLIHI